ncbi:hypothetical protein FKP32DRAFT_945971 [Trametes sanguinea]|nr:hypothetical protein FKP32DRAFT_945971 [Trametes sanguinea]
MLSRDVDVPHIATVRTRLSAPRSHPRNRTPNQNASRLMSGKYDNVVPASTHCRRATWARQVTTGPAYMISSSKHCTRVRRRARSRRSSKSAVVPCNNTSYNVRTRPGVLSESDPGAGAVKTAARAGFATLECPRTRQPRYADALVFPRLVESAGRRDGQSSSTREGRNGVHPAASSHCTRCTLESGSVDGRSQMRAVSEDMCRTRRHP